MVGKDKKAMLILNDGTVICGRGFGACASTVGELVFNTSMMGYQEALTDPSYGGQILLMTYPLIGNYGVSKIDFESDKIQAEGFVVRQPSSFYSDRDAVKSIDEFLQENNKPGIYDIDTREIVRKVRNYGVMPAKLIVYYADDKEPNAETAKFDYSSINFVKKVSTKKPLFFGDEKAKRVVALLDFGVKMGIVRELVKQGIRVVVLPQNATAEDVKKYEPHGVLLSNGPGDPAILTEIHKTIRDIDKCDLPIFGICLGHQLISHAFGGDTYKLKFGHRGSNHPVLDKIRNRVVITTQNHGFAIKNVPKGFEITHEHANDKTIEGIRHESKPIFSVQYHPEASPGPHDSRFLFGEFIKILE